MRKSIVFDIKTPKVFYCPQEKPSNLEQMIVQSKPLEKLCEFGGISGKIPSNQKSDCFNDLDESEFACQEKERILQRISSLEENNSMDQKNNDEEEEIHFKSNKKSSKEVEKKKKKN